MIAFDADVLTEVLSGHAEFGQRAAQIPVHEQGVPIIVVEEILRGRLHSIR
jgi:tRNA(fMet)-specific endonuclease VapC